MSMKKAVKLSERQAKIGDGIYITKPRFPVSVQDDGKWVKRIPTFAEVVGRNNLVSAGQTPEGKKLLTFVWFRMRDGQALNWTVEPEKFLADRKGTQADPEALKLAQGLGC